MFTITDYINDIQAGKYDAAFAYQHAKLQLITNSRVKILSEQELKETQWAYQSLAIMLADKYIQEHKAD